MFGLFALKVPYLELDFKFRIVAMHVIINT